VHENSGAARPIRKVTSFSMVLDNPLQREDAAAFIRISEDIYDAISKVDWVIAREFCLRASTH
jgi:hypothetical protein